ncbi:hypothetical protein NQZ68_032720 [Dissostichus eleginoides]|nr:hypothetical protein NQZ68_032720 [Dissostichus eleginoides]
MPLYLVVSDQGLGHVEWVKDERLCIDEKQIWIFCDKTLCILNLQAKQYSSCTIYGASSVQVAEKVLGHTCQVIQLLDFTPQCAQSQRKSLTMQEELTVLGLIKNAGLHVPVQRTLSSQKCQE